MDELKEIPLLSVREMKKDWFFQEKKKMLHFVWSINSLISKGRALSLGYWAHYILPLYMPSPSFIQQDSACEAVCLAYINFTPNSAGVFHKLLQCAHLEDEKTTERPPKQIQFVKIIKALPRITTEDSVASTTLMI